MIQNHFSRRRSVSKTRHLSPLASYRMLSRCERPRHSSHKLLATVITLIDVHTAGPDVLVRLDPQTSKLSSPLNSTRPSSGVSLTAPGSARGMLKNG